MGEYVNLEMKQLFDTHGIIHQTTCPDTSQQNRVAERKNRTLLEITRSLMFESHVPAHYWPEALATATYLTNRIPTKSLNFKTPLDTLQTYSPVVSSVSLPLRVFGCVVYVHLPRQVRHKLETRPIKCVFLGYRVTQKGYRCFDPVQNKIYTTMDCDFFEHSYFFSQPNPQGEKVVEDLSWLICPLRDGTKEQVGNTTVTAFDSIASLSQFTPLIIPDVPSNVLNVTSVDEGAIEITNDEPNDVASVEMSSRYELPPRSIRGVPPKRYDPEFEAQRSRYPIDRGNNVSLSQTAMVFNSCLYSSSIPKDVKEALQNPKWKKAMEEEITALKKNGTWEKCVLPKGKKTVGWRWVFTIKYHADGSTECYKARLFAKGYTKTYGVGYSETFTPVAKIDTIRVLFSVAANKNWPFYQFDVKNAFLHGEIEEEVYMKAPPDFNDCLNNSKYNNGMIRSN